MRVSFTIMHCYDNILRRTFAASAVVDTNSMRPMVNVLIVMWQDTFLDLLQKFMITRYKLLPLGWIGLFTFWCVVLRFIVMAIAKMFQFYGNIDISKA